MKILVLGAGSIGKRRMRCIEEVDPEAEIYYYDPRIEGVGQVAPKNAVRIKEITNTVVYDAVFDCSPPYNRWLTYSALSFVYPPKDGYPIPVFAEKPVMLWGASKEQESTKIANTLLSMNPRINRVIMAGHNFTQHPYALAMRDLVRAGKLGTVLRHTGTFRGNISGWRPTGIPSFSRAVLWGGGAVMECLQDFFLGGWFVDADWEKIEVVERGIFHIGSELPEEVPDYARVVLQRPAPTHVDVPYRSYLELDLVTPGHYRSHKLEGTNGTAEWTQTNGVDRLLISLKGAHDKRRESTTAMDASYRREVELFLRWVGSGSQPAGIVPFRDVLLATRLAEYVQNRSHPHEQSTQQSYPRRVSNIEQVSQPLRSGGAGRLPSHAR